METNVVDVILTIFQFINTETGMALVPAKEAIVASLDECWQLAVAFNAEAKGTGFVAACWPNIVPALVQ